MAGEALNVGGFYHGVLSLEVVESALERISDLLKLTKVNLDRNLNV
ncbi:MAG: hypothetical protein QXH67_07230 [Candidatus Bathyarchaeia archaeon]